MSNRIDDFRAEQMLDMMDGGIVTAQALAEKIGVSDRTVYRYVGRLRAAGHDILSGGGAGYMLRRRAAAKEGEGTTRDIAVELEKARAEVARLEREAAQGPCREFGHKWKFLGGANAGCGEHCGCSVSVHVCEKCGDCDYGDNDEADEIRRSCIEREAQNV